MFKPLVAVAISSLFLVIVACIVIFATAALPARAGPDATAADSEPTRMRMIYPDHPLAGIVNALLVFKAACLRQGWSDDLPRRLAPKDYKIVTRGTYLWGKDDGGLARSAILTHTGREDSDQVDGFPVIDMVLPTGSNPRGGCTVRWARHGASPKSMPSDKAIDDFAATTPTEIGYRLQAFPILRPDSVFQTDDRRTGLMDWVAPCFDGFCEVGTLWRYGADGSEITIDRVEAKATGAPSAGK